MTAYLMKGADPQDFNTIYATHPALPGTYIMYAYADGEVRMTPVILWAVLSNGTPEPVTLDGVWDGTTNLNKCVVFPDGRCAKFEEDWESVEQAADALSKLDT